jgi:glucuronoarabinoxylan endo-1,4-beta-xylanase
LKPPRHPSIHRRRTPERLKSLGVVLTALASLAARGCGGDTSGSRGVLGTGGAGAARVDPGSGGGNGAGGARGTGGSGAGGSVPLPSDQTVTVALAERHQTLVGFGGAVAFYTNFLSGRNDSIYTVLFYDLGLDILRIGNWYQNQTATGTSTTTAFGDSAVVSVLQKARSALGRAPKVLMSSWSPPAYLKSNSSTKGTRGTLVQSAGQFAYDQFADWWVRSLAAYAAQGVVPDYISIQNEPDFFNAGWETCLLDAAEGTANASYGRALAAVASAIATSSLASKPQIVAAETAGIGNSVSRYLAGMAPADFSVLAHHLYSGGGTGTDPAPDSYLAPMANVAAAAGSKPIFMTEYSPAAPSLFNTAWLIHNALTVEGVAAYIYWGLIWAPPMASAAPGGLVTIQGADPSSPYTINDSYYGLKHFARWTDPGWVRVGAAASAAAIKTSAFVSPDEKSLTVILLNSDSAAHVVTVELGGFAYRSATVFRTSGTSERAAQMPFAGSVELPARAIATVVMTP